MTTPEQRAFWQALTCAVAVREPIALWCNEEDTGFAMVDFVAQALGAKSTRYAIPDDSISVELYFDLCGVPDPDEEHAAVAVLCGLATSSMIDQQSLAALMLATRPTRRSPTSDGQVIAVVAGTTEETFLPVALGTHFLHLDVPVGAADRGALTWSAGVTLGLVRAALPAVEEEADAAKGTEGWPYSLEDAARGIVATADAVARAKRLERVADLMGASNLALAELLAGVLGERVRSHVSKRTPPRSRRRASVRT